MDEPTGTTGPHEPGSVGENNDEKGKMSLNDVGCACFLKNSRTDVLAVRFKDQPEWKEDRRWQDDEDEPPAHAHEKDTEQ
jgi:hypothetical protein